jgi:hypothetical protein
MPPEHLRELANLKLRHPDGTLTSHPQTWCSGPIAIGYEIELALDKAVMRAKVLTIYDPPLRNPGIYVSAVPEVFAELIP